MDIESWMITVVAIFTGVVGTYAVLRNRVARIEEENKSSSVKVEACFKRIDVNSENIIRLQKDTANHLDLVKAEETFVSKKELELHIKILELGMANISTKVSETNDKVDSIEGKLGSLVELLTECRIDIEKDK